MGFFNLLKRKHVDKNSNTVSQSTPELSLTFSVQSNDDLPSLESRIEKAFPSSRGLYPHEILMLNYASSYKTSENVFQRFWEYDYSVLEPQKVLNSLYERGFICRGTIADTLKSYTVANLKAMLLQKGKKTKTKKDDLISQILETYSPSELESLIQIRTFGLTEMGKQELKENEYVPYLHRHHYMSVWEMNILLHSGNTSKFGYRDIIWGELNKQLLRHFSNFDFGLYRDTRLSMCDFLVEEEKYKSAFFALCEVISFDLSGLGNGDKSIPNTSSFCQIRFERKMNNLLLTEDGKEVTLPSSIIKYFKRLYHELGMTPNEFIRYTYAQFNEVSIHEHIFSENECANIILSEIGLEERKILDTYLIAEERLKKQLGLDCIEPKQG